MFDPWHGIKQSTDLASLIAVIEIVRGSKVKYEIDKETGMIKVDRILSSAVHYPTNYGFFPQTYCDDKDPLDVLVLGQEALVPECLVEVRPIGVLKMLDKGEQDDKVIAVLTGDPHYNHYTCISQINKHTLDEIKNFFETYKLLENKKVVCEGFGDCKVAEQVIKDSLELYKKTFVK